MLVRFLVYHLKDCHHTFIHVALEKDPIYFGNHLIFLPFAVMSLKLIRIFLTYCLGQSVKIPLSLI